MDARFSYPRRLAAPFSLPARILVACLFLACGLTGCGDDPVLEPHGLKTAPLSSKPTGEPIEVGFEVEDGAVYTAEVRLRTEISQHQSEGGPAAGKSATASAVLEVTQTFSVPGGEREPTSGLHLVYTAAEGRIEGILDREPITGTLEHERNGRTRAGTLRLGGGTQAERVEARDRLGGLYLAGFAGSPAWLPDRPVYVGEAWAVEGFLTPRGVANARNQARQVGLDAPEPTFSGTIRVVGVSEGPDGRVLELEIDTLIEMVGVFRKGQESGRMSYANQVRGTALISVRTGLPQSFDATEVIRTDVRQDGARLQQRATAFIHGTLTRKK